ncbi:hemagglutinin repeat-containing protein, partial [Octadecabacter sp. G9-8]
GITAGSIGNPALVVTNVDPDASYLVETRFEFIDLDQFLSSDYFLDALGYEPDEYTKRLGDAYVETQFLRAQLFALTGQRLTETGISERDQMQALYDNAIDASVALDLALGVALTPEQIAALTQDIIWLEEITVDGQTVMAPRLYLADASSLARTGSAAGAEASSITAADLTLIADTFTNSGAITGVDSVRLASLGDMDILGGRVVSGGMTQIDVAGTLTSLSGTIQGSDVSLAAQQIVLETARVTSGEDSNFTDGASRASTVLASGDVMIQAIEDINLTGAQVQAGGDTTLAAGGAITVGALELNRETDLTYDGGYSRSQGVTNVVSSIATDGNLTLYAAGQTDTGGNITLMGAQLQAGAGMVIQADQGDVLMLAVADSFYSDITGSSSGFFSESSSRDQVFSVTNQVTSLDAGSIDVLAAGSILAEGTQFRTDGVTLTGEDALQNGDLRLTAATGDLMFTAPTDIYAESRVRERSFFGGLARLSSDIRTLETQALGSVAQVAGDIGLVTGGDLVLTAVDWAANGDIRTQVAGETLLLAAVDTSYRSASILNNNAILITTEDSEDYTESATFNRLDAGGVVDLDPTSPITLDAVRDPTIASMHAAGLLSDGSTGMTLAATYLGLTDPATGPPETLDETTDDWRDDLTMITATLPTGADGNGYLYLDEALERDSTIVNPIALVDEHFHEETTALNPAFKLLITIAVTQGIGGFGELAGGFGQAIGLTGEAAIGAANAAASNLAVGVIEAGVSGDFDIGELLEGAAFAGISAYASGAISLEGTFGVEFGEGAMAGLIRDGGQFTIASFSEGALDAAITSGLSSA